jgi:hypothetical protein
MPKAIIPPAMTPHVATVRQSVSRPVKSHIARMQAITLMMIHIVIVANEIARTLSGFKNPIFLGAGGVVWVLVFIPSSYIYPFSIKLTLVSQVVNRHFLGKHGEPYSRKSVRASIETRTGERLSSAARVLNENFSTTQSRGRPVMALKNRRSAAWPPMTSIAAAHSS